MDEEEEQQQQPDEDEAAQQALQELCQRFTPDGEGGEGLLQLLRTVYGYGNAGFSAQQAHTVYEESSSQAAQLSSWAEHSADPDARSKVSLLMHCIQESYSALVGLTRWSMDADRLVMSDADQILRFVKGDGEKELPVQVVCKFILQHTHRMQLRHRDQNVFIQQFTDDGAPTHAWIAAKDVAGGHDLSTLEQMVAFICTKAHNSAVWTTWLATNTKSIVDKLALCQEPEFKMLKTTRAWLAFVDGLYNVYTDTFVRYADTKRFGIPASMAACAYHKVPFEAAFARVPGQLGIPLHPLLEVPTPNLDKIMETQKLCGHTRFWLLALLGRCLYFSCVLEAWQVVLMLKGRAGTGKSTLVQMMGKVYEPADSVVISNDSQSGFGLQALTPDVYLWCVPELKTDFNVDQAQFQSLVSQERMSIGRKFLGAFDGVIRAHGIMAGNTLPLKWQDNAGSIRRRLFVIEFDEAPPKSDGNLLDKLCTVELPYILRKINWCYRHAAVLLNGRDLWQSGYLSQHILRRNESIYTSMNSLRAFLTDTAVKTDADMWCPLKEFQIAFKTYCGTTNKPHQQWTEEFCGVPFKDSGIAVRNGVYKWGDEQPLHGTVLMGVCIQLEVEKMVVIEGTDNPNLDPLVVENVDYFRLE